MATSRKLFQQGVAAASKVLGSSDTCYCPICTGGFGESALQTKDLTREHVPPQALGGAAIILTCKECNNSAGHTLDAAAARRRAQLKFAEALAGDSVGYAGRAMAKIAGEQIRVDVHKEASGTIGIKFVGGLNDPASVERTKDYFHNLSESGGGLGEEFTLTAHARYHDRFAKLSDLRTAFLACTALLGYKFAFHPSTRQIREQILNPNENLLPRWWTYPSERLEPYKIYLSEGNGVFLVPCERETVVLPFPPSGAGGFEELVRPRDPTEPIRLTAKCIGWPTSFVAKVDRPQA
jgi:hypothetical protein